MTCSGYGVHSVRCEHNVGGWEFYIGHGGFGLMVTALADTRPQILNITEYIDVAK